MSTPQPLAANEARFREANERIRKSAEELDFQGVVPFICECADARCRQVTQLTIADYERVREEPAHFFVAPGHERASGANGRVVREETRYTVVEKYVGEPAELAERPDQTGG